MRHRAEASAEDAALPAHASTSELATIATEWDALADRHAAPPFLRPGWIAAWWRAFGGGRLEILTERRDGELTAVMPVEQRASTTWSASNSHTPEFRVLHADAKSAASVLRQLFDRGSDFVSLAFLPGRQPELNEMRTAAEQVGYRVRLRTLQRSPSILIRGDWSAYERGLSRNLRRDVARCRRRLHQLGRLELDITDAAVGLEERLGEAFAIERSSWKGRANSAMVSRPATVAFYTEVARWAASRGWLRLIFLRVDGRPLAFHLAIEQGGVYFPLKGSFDPVWAAYSPGKVLLHATIERAYAIGLDRYELLGGNEAYKRRWATDALDRVLFQAYTPTLRGVASRAAFGYGPPLTKRALAPIRQRRVAKARRDLRASRH